MTINTRLRASRAPGTNTGHVIASMVYIWGWQMAVRLPFHPTTMSTTIKLPPSLNIFAEQDAVEFTAGRVKLDFMISGVSDLYVALKRFDKRFSNISQDVTDPVRPLDSL